MLIFYKKKNLILNTLYTKVTNVLPAYVYSLPYKYECTINKLQFHYRE